MVIGVVECDRRVTHGSGMEVLGRNWRRRLARGWRNVYCRDVVRIGWSFLQDCEDREDLVMGGEEMKEK